MGKVYGFEGDDVERIRRAVRNDEARPRQQPGPAAVEPVLRQPPVHHVRVTEAVEHSPGRYPAKLQFRNAAIAPGSDGAWRDGPNVWYEPDGGPVPEVGTVAAGPRYSARGQGFDDGRFVFVALGGGAAGLTPPVVRVTDPVR